MKTRTLLVAAFSILVLFAFGCGGKPDPETDLDLAAESVDTGVSDASEMEDESAAGLSRFDDLFKKKPEEEVEAVEPEPAPILVMEDVHFEFDQYSLTAAARKTLAETGRTLKDHPEMRVQIEGHCDDRGTQEYNLALGQRRAQATRDYLVNFGIDPARISIISYGEERPLDSRAAEEAWARNRRGHFNRR